LFGDFKNGVVAGVLAGVLWGCGSMLVNSISGAFVFEHSTAFNLVVFAVGGAIFGVITSGFLVLLGNRLPFKGVFPKAVLVSTSLWVVLRLGGEGLAITVPERYHPDVPQTIQGFLLAVALGAVLNLFWKKNPAS
jgi:hypothetical protein